MQWESWSAFWDMGGFAFFVWGSYGLTLLLVVGELILVVRRRRDTVRRLLRLRRANVAGVGGRRAFEEIVE
ncbi:heme exporter protein CcmD [Aromatoleum toluvorans]|uniref:Heme exporter protein D n=1 Tax=Aromatoleum toluvorans TaxID=92002 RepID=A0ABX1Q1R6_9RHOO|nr:heme exporter protein CcmD [Aromatoleum toluvorans]NMG44696.1 heme exporter protein CcmD [Aromatoleum toluvorans]